RPCFGQRTSLWIRRKLRLLRAKHGEECDIPIAVVAHTSPNSGWNPDEIARTELSLDLTLAITPNASQFALENEKQLLDIGMQVQRTFVSRRNNHRAQREMAGLNNVGIIVLACAAAAHVAHLGASILRIDLGLEIQHTPIELAIL